MTLQILAYMTLSMQNTPIKIHILDGASALPSIAQSFKDHFLIARDLIPSLDVKLTLESEAPLRSTKGLDYLILPPEINPAPPTSKEKSLILSQKKNGIVVACCGGVVKLAHTGALNGKRATTHWMFQSTLEGNFPQIELLLSKVIQKHGNILTAGGIQSYLDVICWIIKKEAGLKAARKYNQFVQGPGIREYQIPAQEDFPQDQSELFKKFDSLKPEEYTLEGLCQRFQLSPRSFQRYLSNKYDTTFREALKAYRLRKIKILLEKGVQIKEISFEVGFQDDVSLRRFFKKEVNIPISKYREMMRVI